MSYFLLIETASDVCSVAIACDDKVVVQLQTHDRDHAAALAPLIQQAIHQAGISINQLSCVAVNGGPGSYTGLRIGLSTAKGICYAASLPLIMIDSLEAYANGLMLHQAVSENEMILSTVENRRDELFYAVFDSMLNRIHDVTLTVTSDEEIKKRLGGKCIVTGSAVEKLSKIFPANGSMLYVNVVPSAINLLKPVLKKFNAKQFSDLAYSEPFYYKEVYIAPKKLK